MSAVVTGWMCALCGRYLGAVWPEQHCPCSDRPMRIRLRVVDKGEKS